MKAYLIESDNGVEYDGYENWVSAVFLVPNDFDRLKIWGEVTNKLILNNLVRRTKSGAIYEKDYSKIERAFYEYLTKNYQELEIYDGA